MTVADTSAVAPPAHRDGNVLRWLCAYTASVTGDVVYFLALSWAATRVAGPSQVGLVVAAGALPRAVLMLGGGVLADRCGPRRVVIGSDATRCVVMLAGTALLVTTRPGVGVLIAVALALGVVDAMFLPAVGALPPRLTTADQLTRVQGLRGLAVRTSNAVGPLVAGLLLAAHGPPAAFAASGALFAASLALLLRVRLRGAEAAPADHGAGRQLRAGLRYLRGHRTLAPLAVVIGLSEMCFSGPVATGLVLLADERGWGAAGMGAIASAFSIGGGAAALTLTVSGRMPRAGRMLVVALLVTALATIALGRAPGLPVAVCLGGLVGAGSGVTGTLTGALLQSETDPGSLGRVSSVTSLCTLGLSPVLLPLVGVTVAVGGAALFFTGCGAVCLLATGLTAAAPRLRRAELRARREATAR